MEKLICEGKEFLIQDFLEEERAYSLDLKIKDGHEFEDFLSLYKNHGADNGVFKFEIAGKCFDGWFGAMSYDKRFNVRVYVGIYDEKDYGGIEKCGKVYSIGKSLIGIGNAIRELCNYLKENDVISKEQENKILEKMNTPEKMEELRYLVEDLPLYLKSTHATLEELREEK